MIKNILAFVLLVSGCVSILAQQPDQGLVMPSDKVQEQDKAQAKAQADAARAGAGCGPSEVQFDVKTDKNQHPNVQPEPSKALVYVFEEEKQQPNTFTIGNVTTRVGLDGKWVGANHGKSYFFLSVDPGEHHLCAEWQSRLKRLAKAGSATTFTAEAGKTYYFRAEVEEREKFPAAVSLELVNGAEGQFLISGGALSTSRAKPVESAEQQ